MQSMSTLQARPVTNPLIDRFGRLHDSLRISVTDRCNIRCTYCMPDGIVRFLPEDQLLRFEQIVRCVQVLGDVGVRKLRLTGGEPLMRPRLPQLIEQLASIATVDDLALTTNGTLLAPIAKSLRDAGLRRINISLDALSEEAFQRISRRKGLHRVLAGIDAAIDAGFDQIRLNAIAIRGITEDQVVPLVHFARQRKLTVRFIEYMPLDADHAWSATQVLTGTELMQLIEERVGPLLATNRPDPSQPSVDYAFADGFGAVGLINPVSQPFCNDCNRLRLTADGKLRNCLFSHDEWDLRPFLAIPDSSGPLLDHIRACVDAKKAGHLISRPGFAQPSRAMYQIGG
jgi:GTP 3',8-cyclase